MGQLVFKDVDVRMFDMDRRVVALAVAGVVLVMSGVLVDGDISPIGELAVDTLVDALLSNGSSQEG